ncbi:MAG TPA: hypothetical protein VIH42_06720 [Thermoguttaceae bacterium]
MNFCIRILSAAIMVALMSGSSALAQERADGNLTYLISPGNLPSPANHGAENFTIRNRLGDGASWIVTADILALRRVGGQAFSIEGIVLVGGEEIVNPLDEPGEELLNSRDFKFQNEFGPRVSLIRQGVFGHDIELNYFGIDGWKASKEVINPNIRQEPGESGFRFDYGSQLHNVEINLRRPVTENMTLLAGFRWVEIHENFDVTAFNFDGPEEEETLVLTLNTDNHLYGFQIGFDGTLYSHGGPLRIDCVLKAGIYGNSADLTVIIPEPDLFWRNNRWHTAFIGEIGLIGVYQVNDHLALRAGYQAMWVEGAALALDQLNDIYSEEEIGPYTGGSLFYHGAIAGLELRF